MMEAKLYDIAVVGSGFAGSLMAMICRRLGRSVILLERGRHPRFTIGESSTPLTNLMLEELSIRYNIPALTPLAKWGTWQECYPNVACGLKRGFTFYHHKLGEPDADDPDRENQLLVAASPSDQIADTHWYRPEFDQLFASEAQKMGVDYLDETELTSVCELADEVKLTGAGLVIRAKFVIDASGPRGFLHRTLKLAEIPMPDFPQTQALYSHFTGVRKWADGLVDDPSDLPPYPIDSAAVHHVFDGGWIWVLQFNNGVTSAGVAATSETAERLCLEGGASAWQRMLALIPKLQEQFEDAQPMRPFTHVPQLSFRSAATAGNRWVMLPSAAGFVDPLFSTGFALTLLGVSRLSEIIETSWSSKDFNAQIRTAAAKSECDILAAARLIRSLYANMGNFPVFVALSHLYFTAVIYSETVRRLGKPELAASFLLHDHPYFGPQCLEIFERARQIEDSTKLCQDIIQAIEPFNLAALGNAKRRNWYPVDARDLYAGAGKVCATAEEIDGMLRKSGFKL